MSNEYGPEGVGDTYLLQSLDKNPLQRALLEDPHVAVNAVDDLVAELRPKQIYNPIFRFLGSTDFDRKVRNLQFPLFNGKPPYYLISRTVRPNYMELWYIDSESPLRRRKWIPIDIWNSGMKFLEDRRNDFLHAYVAIRGQMVNYYDFERLRHLVGEFILKTPDWAKILKIAMSLGSVAMPLLSGVVGGNFGSGLRAAGMSASFFGMSAPRGRFGR